MFVDVAIVADPFLSLRTVEPFTGIEVDIISSKKESGSLLTADLVGLSLERSAYVLAAKQKICDKEGSVP